ncbi:MAG: hypothetical protein RLZZ546_493 [Bacteroidota bacterium]
MKFLNLILILVAVVLISSCSFLNEEYELSKNDRQLAVPIAYGNITLSDVIERSKGFANIKVDGDGKITLLYKGELLRENSTKIFPPFPGLLEFPIEDTVKNVSLPVNPAYRIDKGVFDNTNLGFKFAHDIKEVINVTMEILSVKKDGQTWKQNYTLDFTNDADGIIVVPKISALDYTALPSENKITFNYKAIRPNGERIKLKTVNLNFDFLRFKYLDGYFGNHTFDIKGDVIEINLFDRWKSGGFEIINPKINLDVDNAFGFPVRSKVNELVLFTVGGNALKVESEYINKGIDFGFPLISEIGTIKNTKFQFNSNNSNVGQLFKDKVIKVVYDFDALANPNGDTGLKNFFSSDAFFSVNVDVELPMQISAKEFTIVDTFEINLKDFNDIKAADFKISTINSFPVESIVSAYFLDENGVVIDQLDDMENIKVDASTIDVNGKIITSSENQKVIKFDNERFEKLKKSKRILMTASFDTSKKYTAPVWLLENYGIDIKLSAIATI